MVIGSGPGGYVAAIKAAQLGMQVYSVALCTYWEMDEMQDLLLCY